jgi:phenylpropionate dioxygenase-like ring-hydroxylating dioxygenase large terminal subunit
MKDASNLLYDSWYFAGLTRDVSRGQMFGREIAGAPMTLGQTAAGDYFALGDVCPHRAALLSKGQIKNDAVECPYHGWQFSVEDGRCTHIPSLCAHQTMETQRMGVRRFPVTAIGPLLWVYIAKDPKDISAPAIEPPDIEFLTGKAVMDDKITLNCHVDHAVIGLMDPAHGPFVHQQWWWRSQASIHEKSKDFEPRRHGFAMTAHTPSKNSFAYKILGGAPRTEIRFQLPGIRTEHIRIGDKSVLSFTAVTPINEAQTEIRQIFFSDKLRFKIIAPLLGPFARAFLRQDAQMVDIQQKGLSYNPRLMLIDDADQQAKWYYQLKKAWAASCDGACAADGDGDGDAGEFINPVTAKTLHWRS